MKDTGKKRRLLPIAIVSLTILVACLFGFVGCDSSNPDEAPETPTYTISFVTGEGGSEVPSITDVAGATITPPADPTKANAVFDGWYANADFSGEKVVLPTTMPEGGATYYAKFTDAYTLSFVTGEGGSTVPAITDVAGATITPPADPTKNNAVFDGWYANADFSGEKAVLPTTMPQGGGTYYAKFIDKLTIRFLLADGTVVKSINDIPGAALEAPATPTKDNAVFDGWYATENLTGGKVTIPTLIPDATATYYGRFLNLYTLSYSSNLPAGVTVSGTMQSVEVTEGTPATVAANAFGATGYRFLGWSTTANGAVNVGATLALESNTTLYAVWQRGYQNQLDNGDYLYISGGEAVLVRGASEYIGTYNATAKTFVVTVGAETVTGRLFENNTYSCFGEHSLGVYALYNAYTGEAVTDGAALKLFDNRIAEYDGQRAAYEYVGDGNYSLTVGATVLVFKLGTVTVEEDEVLVYYVRGSEAGKYTLYGDKSVLKIDGYGNLGYSQYGNDNYTAATYAPHADSDGSLDWNGNKVKVSGEYYAVYNEALAGTYTSGSDTLMLDGYMGATLAGADGLYAAKTVAGVDGTFVTVAVDGVEQAYKLDGNTMSAVGNEIGVYDRYENGSTSITVSYSTYNFRIILDGVGGGKIQRKASYSSSWSDVRAEGAYVFADGEYTLTPNTGSSDMDVVRFVITNHATNGSLIVVFYNSTYGGTYTNGEDTLVLDGYGNATYTKAGTASVSDSYTYSSTTVTMGSNKFTVNTSAKTYQIIAAEQGTYYGGSSTSAKQGAIRIVLDGAGNVTVEEPKREFNYDTYEYEYKWAQTLTTGTYTDLGNGVWQFTSNDESKIASFQFKISGSYFSKADESVVFNYTNGNQTLNRDGFGTVVYTDADGAAHTGSYSASGNYAMLSASDGLFTFKLDAQNNTFTVVGNEKGVYTLNGGTTTVELDGEGGAILTVQGQDENIVGAYVATDVDNEYVFTSNAGGLTFTFRISSNKYEVAYEHANTYLGANDFNVLVLDNYGSAQYINEMGAVEYGAYVMLSEHVVRYNAVTNTSSYSYFRIDYNNGLFVKDTNDFVVENGVLVAYTGEGGEIVLPDEVTAIADGAFKGNKTVTTVDLNNVTVIGKSAFENTDITSVTGLKVVEIGDGAFKGSTRLHSATFGSSVAKIADEAFYGVSSSLKAHALAVVIRGTAIPRLGATIFSYNDYDSTFRVDSLDVALSWFADEAASAYKGSLSFGTDSTETTYYNLSNWDAGNELVLSAGRAKRSSYDRWLYVVNGSAITFYSYDAAADNKYATTEVTVENGLFILGDKTYAVQGTAVTYTDADENVLVVTLGKELAATYNGAEVTLSKTVSNWTFDLPIDGNDYTCTISSYSATSATNGTFTTTKVFKEKTFSLTFADGKSSATIKQFDVNAYMLSSNASLLVPGDASTTSVRIDSGSYDNVDVVKTATGYTIIDLWTTSNVKIYYLTEDNGVYTVEKDSATYKSYYKDFNGSSNRVYAFVDASNEIMYVTLRYNSKEYSNFTKQDDGTYLFENVNGKDYVVSVTVSGSSISACNVEEKVAE